MLLLLYPNVCQTIITFLNNVIKRYQNAEKSNPSTWLFNNQLGSAFLSYISLVVFLCAKFPRCFSVALINACIINLLSPLKTFFPCCVKILHLYSLQFKNSFLKSSEMLSKFNFFLSPPPYLFYVFFLLWLTLTFL